jgi:hypothetical protein
VANHKEFFGEGFKGDKTFLLIILLAKWVHTASYPIKNQIIYHLKYLKKLYPQKNPKLV